MGLNARFGMINLGWVDLVDMDLLAIAIAACMVAQLLLAGMEVMNLSHIATVVVVEQTQSSVTS